MSGENISELLDYCKSVAEAEGYTSFSRRAGVGREYLYRILSGKTNPTVHTLAKLAKACDCELRLIKTK